ncbi:MAG: SBBP repeat-containing protein, partial [Deltaproteobacteria bacterium]|nr:SBBP repeat-containing protein [Deltaproteobacteria bacterium]
VDFGGGPLVSAGSNDIYVLKLNPSGQHLSSKRFGSSGQDYGQAVALDANGNALVTGYFSGTVDFGGAPLTSAGSTDIFVLKLAP